MNPTIGIIEDDAVMCQTLISALQREGHWSVRFAVGSLQELEFHWSQEPPDLMLVDLGLPDGDGLDLLRRIRTHWPRCECLVVSVFGDEDSVVRSIEAGAGGYILKGQGEEGIAEHMRYLSEGGSPMSPAIARHLLRRVAGLSPRTLDAAASTVALDKPLPDALTPREVEVLQLLARGEPYDGVARHLAVSVNTVRYHVKSLYGKLGVNTRHGAIAEGQRVGLLAKP